MRMKLHEIVSRLYQLEKRGATFAAPGYDAATNAATVLRSCAGRLSRIAESECNGIERWDSKAGMRLASWTEADQARADRLTAKAESEARAAVLHLFGDAVTVAFQGDPRGAPIGLYIGAASDSRSPDLSIY